ncbi:MAG: PKD domain-containing protein, partial [Bacteroidota bacterium]|nr:PKD domain-containing protein [Bacteroidota bacterium]
MRIIVYLKKLIFVIVTVTALNAVSAYGQTPVANFTANITGGCSPIVVKFQDMSTGNPTSWSWDFGNGATSTIQNPSTTYFTPGLYTVILTATNAQGSNTITRTGYITVYQEPKADFTTDRTSGCFPAKIQFTDQSITANGTNITSWKWDFGDGGSSTQQNPQYIYKSPGSYTIILAITNNVGCTKVFTRPNYIDVTTGVVANFSYVDPGVCSAPETINFTNNSTGPGTLSYNWNLGNGNTATSLNASTTYNTNGNYRVSLIVSSDQGCIDSSAITVGIGKVNTDFVVPGTICPKTTVQFTNNSNPRPLSAFWKFSNGTTDAFINGSASFATGGAYTVTLINTYAVCT